MKLAMLPFRNSGWALIALAATLGVGAEVRADYPHPSQMNQVLQLAYQMEGDSQELYRRAEFEVQPTNQQEAQALYDLHWLAQEAMQFRQDVERYMQMPQYTENSYQQLDQAMETSFRSFPYLNASFQLQQLHWRASDTLDQIRRYYEPQGQWNGLEARRLGRQIDQETTQVLRRADAEAGPRPDAATVRALRDLSDLAQMANRYRQTIDQNWQRPEYSRLDFRRLRRINDQAEISVPRGDFSLQTRRDFSRIGNLMIRLADLYGEI